jgi:phosphatidylglycerophosphate synthase
VQRQPGHVLALTAVAALALHQAERWLARRDAVESRFRACYEVEVDALFVLALSCALWTRGVAGVWILIAGLWRYLFVVIPLIVPGRRDEAPRSLYHRFAYAVLVGSFVLSLIVPVELARLLAALGTLAVSASFLHSLYYRYSPPLAA